MTHLRAGTAIKTYACLSNKKWLFRIFGGLLGRLFSHRASPSHRVTSKEDGKKIDGYPNCSALAGSIPIGLVRRWVGSTPNVGIASCLSVLAIFPATFFYLLFALFLCDDLGQWDNLAIAENPTVFFWLSPLRWTRFGGMDKTIILISHHFPGSTNIR